MEVVQEGMVIGTVDCECGASVPMKVTKGKCVSVYCVTVVGERNGKVERCHNRHMWGRTTAEKMITEFMKGKTRDENQPVQQEPTDLAPGAEPVTIAIAKPDDAAGSTGSRGGDGFANALVTFFTK